jgi:hypothetical protein
MKKIVFALIILMIIFGCSSEKTDELYGDGGTTNVVHRNAKDGIVTYLTEVKSVDNTLLVIHYKVKTIKIRGYTLLNVAIRGYSSDSANTYTYIDVVMPIETILYPIITKVETVRVEEKYYSGDDEYDNMKE